MYNFRLKKYQNGTFQLTFYNFPILSKDDVFKQEFVAQGANYWDEPTRDINDVYNSYTDNPFVSYEDMYKVTNFDSSTLGSAFVGSQDDEYLGITEDDIVNNRDLSVKRSMNRSKRLIYDYGRSNVWDWFFTFTFEKCDNFDKYNYTACQKKISEWFHNVKKRKCPNIKYLVVPEMHKSGAWHFHALVSNCEGLTFVEAKNNQEFRKDKDGNVLKRKGQPVRNKYYGDTLRTSYPNGNIIYNIKNFESGFTTATRVVDTYKSVSYLVKYVTKDLCDVTFGKRRYIPSLNLDKPETVVTLSLPGNLETIIQNIEYNYKVKLSIDCIKSLKVNTEGYSNVVSIFEFNPCDKDNVVDFKEVDKRVEPVLLV